MCLHLQIEGVSSSSVRLCVTTFPHLLLPFRSSSPCGTRPVKKTTIVCDRYRIRTRMWSWCASPSILRTAWRIFRKSGRRKCGISAPTCRLSWWATRRICGTTKTPSANSRRWTKPRSRPTKAREWRTTSAPSPTSSARPRPRRASARSSSKPPGPLSSSAARSADPAPSSKPGSARGGRQSSDWAGNCRRRRRRGRRCELLAAETLDESYVYTRSAVACENDRYMGAFNISIDFSSFQMIFFFPLSISRAFFHFTKRRGRGFFEITTELQFVFETSILVVVLFFFSASCLATRSYSRFLCVWWWGIAHFFLVFFSSLVNQLL